MLQVILLEWGPMSNIAGVNTCHIHGVVKNTSGGVLTSASISLGISALATNHKWAIVGSSISHLEANEEWEFNILERLPIPAVGSEEKFLAKYVYDTDELIGVPAGA